MFSLLKPTVSLVLRPYVLAVVLPYNTTLPYRSHKCEPTISATCLVPYIFGAETLDQ
jgi:hypothetical protein